MSNDVNWTTQQIEDFARGYAYQIAHPDDFELKNAPPVLAEMFRSALEEIEKAEGDIFEVPEPVAGRAYGILATEYAGEPNAQAALERRRINELGAVVSWRAANKLFNQKELEKYPWIQHIAGTLGLAVDTDHPAGKAFYEFMKTLGAARP